MKISLDWLNDYLNSAADADTVQAVLTEVGFPVEDRAQVVCASGKSGTMLDAEITSNRGDCLSHIGLARELAAATDRKLLLPEINLAEQGGQAAAELASVAVEEQGLCPLYTARVITGVKVGPSPQWLVDYLETIGLRTVNNIVDVTNFVLLEMGQPLHAFDLGKLSGKQIIVRRAKKDEPFDAIDGSSHKLKNHMLVIADAKRPVAVAGVMGGLDTEVGNQTTDILLESAIFAPLSVRTTSRAMKLASDSSYRFERGLDPLGAERASVRAAKLIVELAGGQIAKGVIQAGKVPAHGHTVELRTARCNSLLGTKLSAQEQAAYLDRLGLEPTVDGETITCRVPSHRLDLHREVDLIEEIARLFGLHRIDTIEKIHIVTKPPQAKVAAEQKLREVLIAHGYHETITFTFVSPKLGQPFVPEGEGAVVIEDERRKAEPMLRPSILPSLLVTRKANQDRGNAHVKLFETAGTWTKSAGGKIDERRRLAMIRDAEDPQLALRDMRTAIEEAIERLAGVNARQSIAIKPIHDSRWYEVGAEVHIGDTPVGTFGLIAANIQSLFDVQARIVAAELDLPALIAGFPPERRVAELPRFPGIERDLSVIVDEKIPWQAIETAVRNAKPALLDSLEFLTTYRGKPIAKGKKSVSLRMIFRDPSGTLRHDQVDPQVAGVVEALGKQVGAELRGEKG